MMTLKQQATILIVEDDRSVATALTRILELDSYRVVAVDSAAQATNHLDNGIDLVLSDLRIGSDDGIDLLSIWKSKQPRTPFILMTGYGQIASAVNAMKRGAEDYLTKPIHPDELLLLIRECLARAKDDSNEPDSHSRDTGFGLERIVGQSIVMKDVYSRIRRAAQSESTVLILGESGTGKELVAEAIHQNSRRKDGPFISVNMAAVPVTLAESELFGHRKGSFTGATGNRTGRFEAAQSGTIFIDEIGDFALESQAKLLRVLESRTITPVGGDDSRAVDVRVVAATSRNLPQMVAAGQFREDLYYRLSVITLVLPPLRERLGDVALLTRYFLDQQCRTNDRPEMQIEPELMRFLETFDWPGNVRQLRNCLESMVVMADKSVLSLSDLPVSIIPADRRSSFGLRIPTGTTMDDLEKAAVIQALERCHGNRTRAAESLGISVRTLQRRLQTWGIDDNPLHPRPTVTP